MLQGLRTVIYRVPDLAQAIKWYSEVVGHAPYFSEPFYAGFNVGGFELGLLPDAPAGPGGPQAYWGTADIEAEYARLVALGARPHHAIQEVGEGIKVAMLLDPFDNAFGLIENPHFKVEHAG